MPKTYEVNFDGLVGPTHNYSGLSFGNTASTSHKLSISNPKEAALRSQEGNLGDDDYQRRPGERRGRYVCSRRGRPVSSEQRGSTNMA